MYKGTKTTVVRKEDAALGDKTWFVVDADNEIVGRLASRIATVLMGKHKPEYTPHVDTGDFVVVINAERIRFSGRPVFHPEIPYCTKKMQQKIYDRYSGYPGGRKVMTGVELWQKDSTRILNEAVRRMLPKSKLGRHMLEKLKLYVGSDHPHQAQQPQAFPKYV